MSDSPWSLKEVIEGESLVEDGGPQKSWLREYLSWIVKKPLFPWLFFIGSYTFCHLMPHSVLHMSKHMVQPSLYLKEEPYVRHQVPKKMWSVIGFLPLSLRV